MVEARLAAVKSRYPKRETNVRDARSAAMAFGIIGAQFPTLEQIKAYNERLDIYYSEYESFVPKLLEFENMQRRTIKLELVVDNSGGRPAEDLDIWFHVPDGLQPFAREKDLANPPSAPDPPSPPKSVIEQMAAQIGLESFAPPAYRDFLLPPRLTVSPNVSSYSITKTESFLVQAHVKAVKHNTSVSLDPLYVVFDAFETANSFSVDYWINAGNVAKLIKGVLAVIVTRGGTTDEQDS